MTAGGHPVRGRTRIIAALLAAPAIAMAAGITAVESWRVLRPSSSLFRQESYYSLADAIRAGDLLRAHEFIRAGQDPNGLIEVSDAALTNGRVVLVSPLVWAVAMGRSNIVLMLFGFGGQLNRESDRMAACLAEALGNSETIRVLRTYGGRPAEPCPPELQSEPPLLAVVDAAERPKRVE